MLSYTIRRLLQGLLTVLFIATATFVAIHSVPGAPLTNDKATGSARDTSAGRRASSQNTNNTQYKAATVAATNLNIFDSPQGTRTSYAWTPRI